MVIHVHAATSTTAQRHWLISFRRAADRDELYIPKHRTQFFRKSFLYNGVKTWNDLSIDIKSCSTLQSFKRKCKCHLLENS